MGGEALTAEDQQNSGGYDNSNHSRRAETSSSGNLRPSKQNTHEASINWSGSFHLEKQEKGKEIVVRITSQLHLVHKGVTKNITGNLVGNKGARAKVMWSIVMRSNQLDRVVLV
jgi:hypothetical protein